MNQTKSKMGAETIICDSIKSYEKQTLYDRDEFKLIQRVCELRKNHPNLKAGEIQRPYTSDEVYEVEVEI